MLSFIQKSNFHIKELGLQIECVIANDGVWGTKVNGTWTGLLGILWKKEIDIVGSRVGPSSIRTEEFQFLFPLENDNVYLLSKSVTNMVNF